MIEVPTKHYVVWTSVNHACIVMFPLEEVLNDLLAGNAYGRMVVTENLRTLKLEV